MKMKKDTVLFSVEKIKQQLADSSRALVDLTANMVYDNPSLLKSFIEVTWLDQDPWSNRASRIVSVCCCRFPELLKPYTSLVIQHLKALKSEGTVRNYLKIFAEAAIKLTEKNKSILLNLCFDYLSGNYPVAIKVYSMQILFNLSVETPEIGIELSHVIEENLSISSPGYKSRGEKILKKLQRMNFQR